MIKYFTYPKYKGIIAYRINNGILEFQSKIDNKWLKSRFKGYSELLRFYNNYIKIMEINEDL